MHSDYRLLMKGIIAFFFLPVIITHGQQQRFTKTPALGVHVALFDFKGADSLRYLGSKMKTGVAINYQNNLSKKIEYCVTLAGSFLDFTDRKNNNLGKGTKQLLLEADISMRAKMFAPGTLFNPYLQLGTGISAYNNYWGVFIPAGAGCQVNVTRDVFFLMNAQYRLPLTNTQHRHFYASVGIAGTINRKKIDKVKTVPLPVTALKVQPLDSDGDGIVDTADACPLVMGIIRYHGCPPPDRDGDGINDDQDDCPDVKGVLAYRGCPMPDKDQDGIEDAKDKCPDQGGSLDNGGCPVSYTPIKEKIKTAAKNIFFATGSYRLLEISYPPLNEVVQILKDNPGLQLIIEGHTDNTGTPANNQVLSDNRAGAVKTYLINAGIDASRLQSKGYGEQKPVTSNKTNEGRAINRRVEMALVY